MKKIMVGMICSLSSDDDIPIYREVTDEEYEKMTSAWKQNLVNAFYDIVVKNLEERKVKQIGKQQI